MFGLRPRSRAQHAPLTDSAAPAPTAERERLAELEAKFEPTFSK